MPTFSERHGYTAAKAIQFETMDTALRNSLWNLIHTFVFATKHGYTRDDMHFHSIAKRLYDSFHKQSVRKISPRTSGVIDEEERWFASAQW